MFKFQTELLNVTPFAHVGGTMGILYFRRALGHVEILYQTNRKSMNLRCRVQALHGLTQLHPFAHVGEQAPGARGQALNSDVKGQNSVATFAK